MFKNVGIAKVFPVDTIMGKIFNVFIGGWFIIERKPPWTILNHSEEKHIAWAARPFIIESELVVVP
jgi:hypothetical protein